jgi:Ca2+-binding RTX toxin-like protein
MVEAATTCSTAARTSAGRDALFGLGGDDVLRGNERRDRLSGGSGDDTLVGGPRGDRLAGSDGHDYLDGQSGNDVIDASGDEASDGPGDLIICGPGFDRAAVDAGDSVSASCEQVMLTRADASVLAFFLRRGAFSPRMLQPALPLSMRVSDEWSVPGSNR